VKRPTAVAISAHTWSKLRGRAARKNALVIVTALPECGVE
jgi:hypothetical protein